VRGVTLDEVVIGGVDCNLGWRQGEYQLSPTRIHTRKAEDVT